MPFDAAGLIAAEPRSQRRQNVADQPGDLILLAVSWLKVSTLRLRTVAPSAKRSQPTVHCGRLSINLSSNCRRRHAHHAIKTHAGSARIALGTPFDAERPAVNRQVTGSSPVGGATKTPVFPSPQRSNQGHVSATCPGL
jgi:hypothetical protein